MSDIYRSAKLDQERSRLRTRIAELEGENKKAVYGCCEECRALLGAEAERDAKASAYTNTLKCLGRQAETISELEAELARVQSCLAQGKGPARLEVGE